MDNETLSSQFIEETYNLTIQVYIIVGSLALLTYASILHFADELEYIWAAKFSLPTYLYFLSKYPVFLYFGVGTALDLLPSETLSLCNDLNIFAGVVGTLAFIGVQGLVSIRAYSLCQGYRPMTIALCLCFLASLISQIYELAIPICSAPQAGPLVTLQIINSTAVILSDILAFIVIIRQVWGLWKLKRSSSLQRQSSEHLVTLLLRQGILRFSFVLFITTAALLVQIISPSNQGFFAPFQNILSTLLICEFTIDLRRRNTRGSASNQSALDLPTISFEGGPVHSVRTVLGRLGENIIAEMGERNDPLNPDDDPVSEEADALQL